MDLCAYKAYYINAVIFLSLLGMADASYQYFFQDQYAGGRRTALNIFLIACLLCALVRCPKAAEKIEIFEVVEKPRPDPLTLFFFGAVFAMAAILCSCFGKRSVFIWSSLSHNRSNWEAPHRFPENA